MEDVRLQDNSNTSNNTTTHCRFCAQEKEYEEIRDLNVDKQTWRLYLTILEFFKIDFIALTNNDIPKTTCETCYETMLKCYNFFQSAKVSQTVLSEIYIVKKELDEDKKENDEDDVLIVIEIGSETESLAHKDINETVSIKSRRSSDDSNISNQANRAQKLESKMNDVFNESSISKNRDDSCFSCVKKQVILQGKELKTGEIKNYNDSEFQDKVNNSISYFHANTNTQELDDNSDHTSTSSSTNDQEQGYDDIDNTSILSNTSPMDYFPTTYCGFPIFNNTESECNDIHNKYKDESWMSYPWCCKHCQVECDSMDDLRSHSLQLHKKCYGFECDDCDSLIFYTFNSFIEHVRQHRGELRYYCAHCNEQFETVSDCTEHTLTHWADGQRICDWCGKVFPDKNTLKLHKLKSQPVRQSQKLLSRKPRVLAPVRKFNEIPVFQDESNVQSDFRKWNDYHWTCRDCLQRFTSAQLLRTHTQEIHGKCFSMKCSDCTIESRTYNQFLVHVTGHRPHLKSICPYCNKNLKPEEFKKHVNDHFKGSLKSCYECGQIFDNKLLASQHYDKFEPLRRDVTTEELTCDICGLVFNTLPGLRTHKKIHDINRKKDHVCDTCGKQYYTKGGLDHHILTHDDRKHICKVCDKVFTTELYLKKHVRRHLSKNVFICDYCSKGFKVKSGLCNHIKVHLQNTKDKFKCQVCSKILYNSSSNLKIHMRTHTGERPYKCQHCEKSFANWSNCNKHMVRLHKTSLSKSKLTKLGKLPVDKLEKVKNMTADTEEWMQKIGKYTRDGAWRRRERNPTQTK